MQKPADKATEKAENRWFESLKKNEYIMADKGFRGLNDFHASILPRRYALDVTRLLK